MDILFLSHCVPYPPDKGEKIRAWHELQTLGAKHRIHLVCFAKNEKEAAQAQELKNYCASIFAQPLGAYRALARAALGFAVGASLNISYYRSAPMRRHIESLRPHVAAVLAYSSAVVQFAPAGVPLYIDFVDVDSEKWREYGARRQPGALYRIEANRLRACEARYAQSARCTFVTTPREQRILETIAPGAGVESLMNGVDFDFFDPARLPGQSDAQRDCIVFVGQMSYFPNVDGCRWFAKSVFGELRAQFPALEFLIVGRDPVPTVRQLASIPGVRVIGPVPDVRPYLASALAMVAPLRIARGVQNKVLEALAMGKRVLASPEVASTFGESLPEGITVCKTGADYACALPGALPGSRDPQPQIRESARTRFCWERNLLPLIQEMEQELEGAPAPAPVL
jgi:polysaccharide biosynthesis protein PslH